MIEVFFGRFVNPEYAIVGFLDDLWWWDPIKLIFVLVLILIRLLLDVFILLVSLVLLFITLSITC